MIVLQSIFTLDASHRHQEAFPDKVHQTQYLLVFLPPIASLWNRKRGHACERGETFERSARMQSLVARVVLGQGLLDDRRKQLRAQRL